MTLNLEFHRKQRRENKPIAIPSHVEIDVVLSNSKSAVVVATVSNFARSLAVLLAISLACVVPTYEAAASPTAGPVFSKADTSAELVLAAPERGADFAVSIRLGKDRPVWFDRAISTSLVDTNFAATPHASGRVASTLFRAPSLVGIVELRI